MSPDARRNGDRDADLRLPGRLGRSLRTARHLDAAQAVAWVRRRVLPPPPFRFDPSAGTPVRSGAWDELAAASRSLDEGERASGRTRADALAERRFRFLGVERRLAVIDWATDYESPLWTYRLQYLDYTVDLARAWKVTGRDRYGERLVDLWSGWLSAAERGAAKMEAYPVSVRVMSLLRCLWLVEDRLPADLANRLAAAAEAQLRWLEDAIERHLRANHLQKNLTALAWGSVAFVDGERYRPRREELWDELLEQVLPDGGHFERSPMYHAEALDDFARTLHLCRAAKATVPGHVPPRLASMARALQWLSRADGTFHLFNDTADGGGADRGEAIDAARRVLSIDLPEPAGSFALPHTGYWGWVDPQRGTRLVIDAGPPGPPYQPGHAHCDMLSFELDLWGCPLITDSGVHGYDGDPFREYVRSTRAHNTVGIDGGDQHEMWATFRVGRRGEIVGTPALVEDDSAIGFRAACRHHHVPAAVHRRRFEFEPGSLRIHDAVDGAAGRRLTAWLHLHPATRMETDASGVFVEAPPGSRSEGAGAARLRIQPVGADDWRLLEGEREPLQGWFCPRFGTALPAPVLEMRVRGREGGEFGWRLEWEE